MYICVFTNLFYFNNSMTRDRHSSILICFELGHEPVSVVLDLWLEGKSLDVALNIITGGRRTI